MRLKQRGRMVSFRVSDEEFAKLEENAAGAMTTISDWVRQASTVLFSQTVEQRRAVMQRTIVAAFEPPPPREILPPVPADQMWPKLMTQGTPVFTEWYVA